MGETPVKKNKTSRRLNLKESLESYNSRRLQQQEDGEEPTPATKKKPYTQLCEVPWILHVEENGEMVEKAYYHPKYVTEIDDKIDGNLAEFDTKMKKIVIGDIPAKKNPPKRVSYDLT